MQSWVAQRDPLWFLPPSYSFTQNLFWTSSCTSPARTEKPGWHSASEQNFSPTVPKFTHTYTHTHTHTHTHTRTTYRTQHPGSECKPRPWEAQLTCGLGSQTLEVNQLQEQGCASVSLGSRPWVWGFMRKWRRGSHLQQPLFFTPNASAVLYKTSSVCHFSHSVALCRSLSCCSLWLCFTCSLWLLLTAISLGFWTTPTACALLSVFPREGISRVSWSLCILEYLSVWVLTAEPSQPTVCPQSQLADDFPWLKHRLPKLFSHNQKNSAWHRVATQ